MNFIRRRAVLMSCVVVIALTVVGGAVLAGPRDTYPYQYWAPYQGILKVNVAPDGYRYAWQDMNWGPRSGYFFRDSQYKNGYEHETWFYDYCPPYGECAYSRSASYWWTTLPTARDLDNNYANPAGEVNIEVMTLDADRIETWTWYWADLRLVPNSDRGRVKIIGARTVQPLACVRWFCPTQLQSVTIVPYGSYWAPGGDYFWAVE